MRTIYVSLSIIELTEADIGSIDNAGATGTHRTTARLVIQRIVAAAAFSVVVLGTCSYMGIGVP